MNNEIAKITPSVPQETRQQAETDERLIDLWVHGRSPSTIRAYRSDAKRFLRFVKKTLREVTLGELQAFADSLDQKLAPASRHRCLSSIKSLYAIACSPTFAPRERFGFFRLGFLHC